MYTKQINTMQCNTMRCDTKQTKQKMQNNANYNTKQSNTNFNTSNTTQCTAKDTKNIKLRTKQCDTNQCNVKQRITTQRSTGSRPDPPTLRFVLQKFGNPDLLSLSPRARCTDRLLPRARTSFASKILETCPCQHVITYSLSPKAGLASSVQIQEKPAPNPAAEHFPNSTTRRLSIGMLTALNCTLLHTISRDRFLGTHCRSL